jgi:hypothetical protein
VRHEPATLGEPRAEAAAELGLGLAAGAVLGALGPVVGELGVEERAELAAETRVLG